MSLTIRNFLNTDIDAICRVWNAHYADHGFACRMDPLRLELCTLAKPYFDASELFVAEYDGTVVGFAHMSKSANESLADFIKDRVAVSALCVEPCAQESAIAQELLSRCDQLAREYSATECYFKPMLPDVAFYLGLGPADSLLGVTSAEQRVCQWIKDADFKAMLPTSQWVLDLATFQPPVDRVQVQLRRGAHVDRQVDEPLLPWWQACALGHTEPVAFHLTHRLERRVLQDILFWSIAPELQSTPEAIAWLWPPALTSPATPSDVKSDATLSDQLLFLVAESLRQLQGESLDTVRTVTAASDDAISTVLKRLGFKPLQSGVVFQKKLS